VERKEKGIRLKGEQQASRDADSKDFAELTARLNTRSEGRPLAQGGRWRKHPYEKNLAKTTSALEKHVVEAAQPPTFSLKRILEQKREGRTVKGASWAISQEEVPWGQINLMNSKCAL